MPLIATMPDRPGLPPTPLGVPPSDARLRVAAEKKKAAAEEQKKKAADEEQKKKAAAEEQKKKAAAEELKKAADEQHKKKAAGGDKPCEAVGAQGKEEENPTFACRICKKQTDADTEADNEALYQAAKFGRGVDEVAKLTAQLRWVCRSNILNSLRKSGQEVCSDCGWDEVRGGLQ